MSSEALITVFLGFGAAVTSLTFWKLSQSRSDPKFFYALNLPERSQICAAI